MKGPADQPPGQSRDTSKINAAVAEFGAELKPLMLGDGWPEERLRAPTYALLKRLGKILGRKVVVHSEVPVSEVGARPDLAVDTASGRVGYVELKSTTKGIPGNWHPTKRDREQQKKFNALPNIIYTNGTSWALYQKGVRIGRVAILKGDLSRVGEKLAPIDEKFEELVRTFFDWCPSRPSSLRSVVVEVAPLCGLLRDQVVEVLDYEKTQATKRSLTGLAADWRNILFPTLDDNLKFADAYAQTVTFSLLLARVDGIAFENRSITDIAQQLGKQHLLMGEALSILTDPKFVRNLSVVDTIRRVIGNINWSTVQLTKSEAYTLLYERFLTEYDPSLRRRSGTYYTPDEVARAMVRFADDVLKQGLQKKRGLASDDVIVVDPAMGTGTFLVEIIESVVSTLQTERHTTATPKAHLRELFASRLVGFEIQAAPYAVAELRLHHILKNKYQVDLPAEEVRFLSNTFDNPDTPSLDAIGQLYEVWKDLKEGADRIKRHTPVMVVIGNPPWREHAKGEAPWLEAPRDPGKEDVGLRHRPSLDEFKVGRQGRRAFNLSNMWTFFWRWATWKVFDANPADSRGVVVLITPSAYTTSESHAGMRRYLRATADEGWIVDVTPEGFQPPVSTRLFPTVQQPICIGIFARRGTGDSSHQAEIRYTAIHGSREQKIRKLLELSLAGPEWHVCSQDWESTFRPVEIAWESYPRLDDLFPWQHTGVTSNRNWVWAPDENTLRKRWNALLHADKRIMAKLFKETRDRKIDKTYSSINGVPSGDRPLAEETDHDPNIVPIAFRSFNRQYLIYDRRVIDFPRPELWYTSGKSQIYASEPPGYRYQSGPAMTFSALVPNVDHFMGHHGGRTIPLYRDPNGQEPNISKKVLDKLSIFLGLKIAAEDVLAYVAAIVAHSAFTEKFSEKLSLPGIRVPITIDKELWHEGVDIGKELIWVHTFGERYVDEAAGRPRATPRLPESESPMYIHPIPDSEESMPDRITHDPESWIVTIGEDNLPQAPGQIANVNESVFGYTVGGTHVIRKWFDYRKKNPDAKRRTSQLDHVNPTRWTAQFDDELLDLLHVLGRCVALEPRQAELLDKVCAGPLVSVSDLTREGVLPIPDHLGKPPRIPGKDWLLGFEEISGHTRERNR